MGRENYILEKIFILKYYYFENIEIRLNFFIIFRESFVTIFVVPLKLSTTPWVTFIKLFIRTRTFVYKRFPKKSH